MVCPNCNSSNSMKWFGEYPSCIQCGYEDYNSQYKPEYKSNRLYYKARYAGDMTSQGAVTVDVKVTKWINTEKTSRPNFIPICPFDKKDMELARDRETNAGQSKYKCTTGHTIWIHTDRDGNFHWN